MIFPAHPNTAGRKGPSVSGHKKPPTSLYLTMMNLVMLCLVLPPIGYVFLHQATSFRDIQLDQTIQRLRHELEARGASLTRTLALHAGQAAAGYDFSLLGTMVSQVVENDPEILYCLVMDANRQVLAHSSPAMQGIILHDATAEQAAALFGTTFQKIKPELDGIKIETIKYAVDNTNDDQTYVLEIIAPVYSGTQLWGVLRCGFSRHGLRQAIHTVESEWSAKMRQFTYSVIGMTGLFFLFGVVIALLFTRLFTRSTRLLSDGVDRISEGDLTHSINQNTMFSAELQHYAGAFNAMTRRLRHSHEQLEEYNRSLAQKVEDRTQELRDAQAELVKQAHEAGKAEMAVGVLHNIGNAITPAKVAITLLQRRLEKSPLRTIGASIEKLGVELKTPGKLPVDEKHMLIELARLLPASIREEYDRILREILKIRDKHEHIEGIIGLQMRYARLLGTTESINVNEIIRDALKILNESITNRKITVVSDLRPVPNLPFEKSKLMQIIINLLKNGYEALDGTDFPERILSIATCHETTDADQQGVVSITIKDTGCGFDPETKKNLFTFGFTTKRRGSGLGLHSSANYLIANNGTITAHSDGKGKGAQFVINLPVGLQEDSNHV